MQHLLANVQLDGAAPHEQSKELQPHAREPSGTRARRGDRTVFAAGSCARSRSLPCSIRKYPVGPHACEKHASGARPFSRVLVAPDELNIEAVTELQAKVEKRAILLRQDVDRLSQQKCQIVRRQTEEALNLDVEAAMQRHAAVVRIQGEKAVNAVFEALRFARAEHERAIREIDENLALVDHIRAAALAEKEQQETLRQRRFDSLCEWVTNVKAAQRERLAQQAREKSRWIQENSWRLVRGDPVADWTSA